MANISQIELPNGGLYNLRDTSKQEIITASGILKGDGNGTITAAVADTDYQSPLPSQTGNNGKVLTTDGTNLSWAIPSGVKVASNPAITAANGKFTWTISSSSAGGSSNPAILILVYEVSTGNLVYPDITVNQNTGNVTILINDTASSGALVADTYKAIIVA